MDDDSSLHNHHRESRDLFGVHQGEVETEGVPVKEVGARQAVPLVLRHLAGGGEHVDVTPDVQTLGKIRLERFGGYMSTVHVHGEEVDFVVLGVKRVFRTYDPTYASFSMKHSTRSFDRVPRNRFSSVCDMAPCEMEYTLQPTGRNGYLAVPLSCALMCAIWTA